MVAHIPRSVSAGNLSGLMCLPRVSINTATAFGLTDDDFNSRTCNQPSTTLPIYCATSLHTFHQRNVVAQSPFRPHCGRHRVLLSFASQCIKEASEVSLHDSPTTILRRRSALHSEDGAENPYAGPATIGRHRTRLHVGNYTWVRCYNNSYVSSTYSPVDCSARLCKSYEYSACYTCTGPRAPGCNNHSCSVPEPGVQLGQDAAALFRSDGRHYPALRLPFSCAERSNPSDFIRGIDGVAGMTSSTLALPGQLSAARRLSRKFGMCLSQEGTIFDAYLFFGDCPLVFSPLNGGHPRDLSRHLIHTPLIRNPIKIPNATHASTHGFYIDVQGIKVNGVDVPIDAENLRIGPGGRGGTKLSTVVTYTQLATPIYNSLVAVYTQVAKQMNLNHVDLVEPYPPPLNYGVCFASPVLRVPLTGSTDPGLNIPSIDLVLPGNTTWRILGINSMERDAIDGAFCLAFVDAGEDPVASIVIGTFQMQETLLQFDLGTSTLGFSSNLLSLPQPTRCNNFNLTTAL